MALIDDAIAAYGNSNTEVTADWGIISQHITDTPEIYSQQLLDKVAEGYENVVIGNAVRTAVADYNKSRPKPQRISKKREQAVIKAHETDALNQLQTYFSGEGVTAVVDGKKLRLSGWVS